MTSHEDPQDTSGTVAGKPTSPISVHCKDWRLARLLRQAAAKRDRSRSEFMMEASIRDARAVMQLNRDEDFQAWLERQAA